MEVLVHVYIIRRKRDKKIIVATVMTDEDYKKYKDEKDDTTDFSLEIITKKIKIK